MLAHHGVRADVAGDPPHRYRWMPGARAMLPDDQLCPPYEAVVVLDGDRHRLTPGATSAFEHAPIRGIIDHHASTREDGYTHTWLAPDATSTTTMLYAALQRWNVPLDRSLATLLYTGLVFDSGGFRYSNTTAATHRVAAHLLEAQIDHVDVCARILAERREAGLRIMGEVFRRTDFLLDGRLAVGEVTREDADRLGLVDGDLEGIVDALLHVVGVEVAALLVERPDDTVKYSLRSRGRIDVARVAAALAPGGGGHAKAAGACIRASRPDAGQRLVQVMEAALRGGRGAGRG